MHDVDKGHDLTSHTAITRNSSTVTSFQIFSPKCSSIQIQNHLDMSFMMSNSETPHLDTRRSNKHIYKQIHNPAVKTCRKPNRTFPPNSCNIIGCFFSQWDPRNSKWKRSSSSKAVAPNLGSRRILIDSKVQLVDCPTVSYIVYGSRHTFQLKIIPLLSWAKELMNVITWLL